MFKDKIAEPLVLGRLGIWRVFRDYSILLGQTTNQLQLSWGAIATEAIGRGNPAYKIAAMYIEFENVANPGDPVTIPTFGRDEGIEYYTALMSSSVRDFLRVPLILTPSIEVEPGFENAFSGDQGNLVTFFTQSVGTQGFNGKTYSDSVNSKVFGAALVATPNFADQSQDVIFARSYYDVADQTLKEASSQVGITWEVLFD